MNVPQIDGSIYSTLYISTGDYVPLSLALSARHSSYVERKQKSRTQIVPAETALISAANSLIVFIERL